MINLCCVSHRVGGSLLQQPQEVVQFHTEFTYSGCSGKSLVGLEEENDEFLGWSHWLLYRELVVREQEWEEMGSGEAALAVVTCSGGGCGGGKSGQMTTYIPDVEGTGHRPAQI